MKMFLIFHDTMSLASSPFVCADKSFPAWNSIFIEIYTLTFEQNTGIQASAAP